MKDLFYMGGPLFMGVLTLVLISMFVWAIYHIIPVLTKQKVKIKTKRKRLMHIKTIGTFGLATGILGQLIGLYAAFSAVEECCKEAQFLWGTRERIGHGVTPPGERIDRRWHRTRNRRRDTWHL